MFRGVLWRAWEQRGPARSSFWINLVARKKTVLIVESIVGSLLLTRSDGF
jgi:hypothetical protein